MLRSRDKKAPSATVGGRRSLYDVSNKPADLDTFAYHSIAILQDQLKDNTDSVESTSSNSKNPASLILPMKSESLLQKKTCN